MVPLLILAFFQIATSIFMVAVLDDKNYWLGLVVLFLIFVIKVVFARVVRLALRQNFAEVFFSIVNVAVLFIVVGGFGYADVVHWAIIAPLLITTYLIGYMGLRIGIATKQPAPKAAWLETISLPVFLSIILLAAAFLPDAVVAGVSLTNCIGIALLAIFIGLTFQRVRLARAQLMSAVS